MSKNEALLKSLNSRMEDYYDAYKYFKQHNLSQQEDCLKKFKILEMAKNFLTKNEIDKLKELSIPSQIKPDYICGCSLEEREKKFNLIINELNREMKEKEKELVLVVQKLKSLEPEKFKKIEAVAKKDIVTRKEKIEKFKKIISLLNEKKKNVWTPVPLCGKDPNTNLLTLTQIYPPFKNDNVNYSVSNNDKKENIENKNDKESNILKQTNKNDVIHKKEEIKKEEIKKE